jgi:hypothetical protein
MAFPGLQNRYAQSRERHCSRKPKPSQRAKGRDRAAGRGRTKLEAQSGRLMPTDFPARPVSASLRAGSSGRTNAFCALRIPAGRWPAPRREPARLKFRVPARPGSLQKPIYAGAAHRGRSTLPAGIPNAINAILSPPFFIFAVQRQGRGFRTRSRSCNSRIGKTRHE